MVAVSVLPANPKVAVFSTILAALTFYLTLEAQPYYLDEVGLLNLISLGLYAPLAILLIYDTYRRRSDMPATRLTARPISSLFKFVYNARFQLCLTVAQCALWLGFIGVFVADLYTEYSHGQSTLACPSSRCGSYFFALQLSYIHFFLIFTQLISFSLVLIEIKTSPRRVTSDRTVSQLLSKSLDELVQFREEAKRVRAELSGGDGRSGMVNWLGGGRMKRGAFSLSGGGNQLPSQREHGLEGEIGGQQHEHQTLSKDQSINLQGDSPRKSTFAPSSKEGEIASGGARRRTRTVSAEASDSFFSSPFSSSSHGIVSQQHHQQQQHGRTNDSVVFSLRTLSGISTNTLRSAPLPPISSASARASAASPTTEMGFELEKFHGTFRPNQIDNGRYPPPYSTDGPRGVFFSPPVNTTPTPNGKRKMPLPLPRLSVRFDLAEAYELPIWQEDEEQMITFGVGMAAGNGNGTPLTPKGSTPQPYGHTDNSGGGYFINRGGPGDLGKQSESILTPTQNGLKRVLYPLLPDTPTNPGLSFSPISTIDSPGLIEDSSSPSPSSPLREEMGLVYDSKKETTTSTRSSRKGKKARWGLGKAEERGYFDLEMSNGQSGRA
ncbi:hypothetical protein IAR55_007000 [Kwoniella newhampshirensis]|uniref:Uncharacterized protein n=1 Tax=Kwoniella newhampshirensis TaxID=1651941 RepID=A0AAW0YT61_9TREE